MNSSDFRERFELIETTYTVDHKGDQVVEDEVVYASFAKVSNLSAREYWDAYALKQESTLKLYCRWHPIFDELDTRKAKVRWRNRIYDITSISNIDYRNEVCELRLKVAT